MSAAPLPELHALGRQLLATLERYRASVDLLVASEVDPDVYRRVSGELERLRLYAAELPEVRVQWVELLIAHAELMHFLWRLQHANRGAAREELAHVRAHHADCAAALAARCQRMLARQAALRPAAAEAGKPGPAGS